MRCDWKHQPPAVVTEGQARDALLVLKQLHEMEVGIDERYGGKVRQLAANQLAEKVLEFDGVADTVPFGQYRETLRDRITEFGLHRMEVKTLKVEDAGQIAVRSNPDKIEVDGGKERLAEVQDALSGMLVDMLKSVSLAALLSEEQKKAMSKGDLAKARATPLLGLFRLKVEADTDSIKARLKSGELKPTDLPPLGYQWTQGETRVDISVK